MRATVTVPPVHCSGSVVVAADGGKVRADVEVGAVGPGVASEAHARGLVADVRAAPAVAGVT